MEKKIAYKVSIVSIVANVVLSIIKAVIGIAAKSGALISDAIHSLSDVASTVIVILGVRIASKEDDKEHPYGHDRFECVASIVLSVLLAVVAVLIVDHSIDNMHSGAEYARPGRIGIYAAILSILVKELMYWYTRHYALQIKSSLLMADAWHHRSDALSSIGAFIGLVLEQFNVKNADNYASIVISIFILKVACDVFKDAIDRMVDKSCDNETIQNMRSVIIQVEGVRSIDLLKTRVFGSKIYIDLEISADETITLKQAHDIAEKVHDLLEEKFPDIKHCMVHVNPISL